MQTKRRSRPGFTLIELLVVLVILALLAGLVLPRILGQTGRAKVGTAKSQISAFKTAISLYQLDNDQPPSTQQGLQALVVEPTTSPRPRKWRKGYLSDTTVIPPDPWGNPYQYESPGPNGEDYLITCLGADGKPGGENEDADILSNQTAESQ
jgi:general secretion pathway protein G